MKKKAKKLVLTKETLRALEKKELKEAAGGTGGTCNYPCNPITLPSFRAVC